MPRNWLIATVLLAAAGKVLAADPVDPALLEYLATFGDEKGAIFDPSDLDDASHVTTTPPRKDPPKQESTDHD